MHTFTANNALSPKLERWEMPLLNAPQPVAGELATMRQGMGLLVDLLTYARPHNSETEALFVREWLLPRLDKAGANPEVDGFGNVWARVEPKHGLGPSVLWSCHVDTVHAKGGRQGVQWRADGRTLELVKRKAGSCLGADDGAGVWLLLEMIKAGVAGGYVFHRGEEVGRLGSQYVVDSEPERLAPYDACVAFDRRDYDNLITHQMGEECTSPAFAAGLAAALNKAGTGLSYSPDDTGSYTDSYSYAGHISECLNMSVGYHGEHGPRETLDALHLWRLRDAVCAADFTGLKAERDPADFGLMWGGYGGYFSGTGGSRTGAKAWQQTGERDLEALDRLADVVGRYPAAAAELLDAYGIGLEELLDFLSPSEMTEALSVGSGTGWAMD